MIFLIWFVFHASTREIVYVQIREMIISIESRYVDIEKEHNVVTSLLYSPSLPSVILIVTAIVIIVIVLRTRRLHADVLLRTQNER